MNRTPKRALTQSFFDPSQLSTPGVIIARARKEAPHRMSRAEPTPGEHFIAGVTYIEQRRWDTALACFAAAVRGGMKSWAAYNNVAFCLMKLDRFAEAIEFATAARAVAPREVIPLLYLGHCYMKLGRFGQAASSYQEALGLKPDHLETLVALADVYVQDGRLTEAFDLCGQALEVAPDHAHALYLLGRGKMLADDAEAAITYLERAEQLDPKNVNLLTHYGACLYSLKRFELAGRILRRAVRLDRNEGTAHLILSRVYAALGDEGKAQASALRALDCGAFTAGDFQAIHDQMTQQGGRL